MLHLADVAHRFRTLLRHVHSHEENPALEYPDLPKELEERFRAAEALAGSEERLRIAMEATALGSFEWDIATDHVKCSPNVKKQLGFLSHNSLTLESIISRIHPDDREAVRATIRSAMEANGSHTYGGEFRTFLPDGSSTWIDARGVVLFRDIGTQPQCMIGIVLDITERKTWELNLSRNTADLDTANRLKDEFMAGLAHKLRNPLTPIRNGLEILALTGYSDPTQRKACDLMARQVRHLMHLVDELLDTSLVNRGAMSLRKEVVTLQSLVHKAIELVRPHLDTSGHELKVDLPDTLILLEADPVRLAQAIANVLENSSRYTPAGGRIIVRVRTDRNGAAVEILDNGAGISPTLLPHVFELFGTKLVPGHPNAEGLGVGLALARALVEMHGGSIRVASDGLGSGSEFRLWVPVIDTEDTLPAGPIQLQRGPLPRRRVLLIDGNPDSAESTMSLLQLLGQRVRQLAAGQSLEDAVSHFSPHIILLAPELPEQDAYHTAQRIRALPLRKRPTIVLMGDEQHAPPNCEPGGPAIDIYLRTPPDPAIIRRIIGNAASAKR
jgi:PAS domain S-box-containing protein